MNKSRLIWGYMRGSRLLYFGAIIATALATFFAMLGPLVIRGTIDSIIGDNALAVPVTVERFIQSVGGKSILAHNLWICAGMLVFLTILSGMFQYFRGAYSAKASEAIARNLRDRLYDHLQHLPYEYHVKAQTGDLLQRCSSDVDTLRKFLATQFVEIGRAVFMVVQVAVIMVSLDIRLAMISFIAVPIIFTFAYVFFQKVQKVFLLCDECEGQLSAVLQENLAGMRVVRAFARQTYEIAKYDEKNTHYRDLMNRLMRLFAMYWAISDLLGMFQIAVMLVLGAYLGFKGSLSIGTLVVFLTYAEMLLRPVRQMGRVLADMGQAFVAVGRIQEILDEPVEIMEETYCKPKISGNIEFSKVGFRYQTGDEVLKDITFSVKKGQTIAILGSTGSGKTSLVNLLLRLYDYTSGSIKLDGTELREIDRKWVRQNIGITSQEPFLFSKTIKDNISLSKINAGENEICTAAKIAAIHETVQQFEKRYDTVIGEKGITLSGGQKQRVTIARTILQNYPILIFDDSLSAVDAETDSQIRFALSKRRRGTTTFIISHRVATLREADVILVMEKGRITQTGTHEQLVSQEGLYRKIWQIQNAQTNQPA